MTKFKKSIRNFRHYLQQQADSIAPYAALFNPYGGVWHLLKQADAQEDYERMQKKRRDEEMKMKREYYEQFIKQMAGGGRLRKNNRDSLLYTTAKLRAIIDK